MDSNTPFRLQSLGGFQLLNETTLVPVRGGKFQAFLAYLANRPGWQHGRDHLCVMFWPDSETSQAKQNLRSFLSRLRKLLGERSVVTDDASVGLNAIAIRCDAADFEQHAGSADDAVREKALVLYQGTYLLGLALDVPGWEDWVATQRRVYHELAVSTAVSLAAEYARREAHTRTIEFASAAIRLDDFNEVAQEILLSSLLALDRKVEALRHYRQYAEHLASELDASPGRRLRELHASIQDNALIKADSPLVESGSKPKINRNGIAVLPFNNLDKLPEQDSFCIGVSEDILTELSRFRDLFVIDRHSSFAPALVSAGNSEIRDILGVRYLVRGSIQRYVARLRLSVNLIDAEDNRQVWAERYDRDIAEIFGVQDDLVRTISATVVGWMERRGREKARMKPTSDLQAYDLVIRGRRHFLQMMPEQNRIARALFFEAIERDPTYCAAHTWLAESHIGDWAGGWTDDPATSLSQGHEIALHALGLDDTDSRAHTALARALSWQGNFERARYHLERALELNFNDTWAIVSSARCHLLEGRVHQGLQQVERAAQLNPLGRLNYHFGIAYYANRQYDKAFTALRAVNDPIDLVYAWLAASLAMAGKSAQATEAGEWFDDSYRARYRSLGQAEVPNAVGFLRERFPFQHGNDRAHFEQGLSLAGIASG